MLAENLAWIFGSPVYDISFHVNTDSSSLIGTDTFVDNEVKLREGPIYQCARWGGFGILDEINMAKSDAVSVLHQVLDFRRTLDVPGYARISLHPAARFIATMNYGYAGTKELNEALVSRFMVIHMPSLTMERMYQILENLFPGIRREAREQFAGLFLDLQLKAQNGEISTKAGEETSLCSSYLKNLIALGLIRRETPFGEKSSRKSIYVIDDNMFRFWYRFVPENSSVIARGASELAYKRIEPYLSDYMGSVFEEICRQYLWKLLLTGQSPVEFRDLGRWWGTDPITRSQTEIDIMGEQDKDTALFCECKWRNEQTDAGVLETLLERTRIFRYTHKHLYLFSKSGFTKGCEDRAKELGCVSLVDYADMLKVLLQD